ncbi:MAG TPA: hypothetical protein VNP03_02940 [Pseudonocardia sp.]|nr:hypothetical protein [Pseudonocardia sp.]
MSEGAHKELGPTGQRKAAEPDEQAGAQWHPAYHGTPPPAERTASRSGRSQAGRSNGKLRAVGSTSPAADSVAVRDARHRPAGGRKWATRGFAVLAGLVVLLGTAGVLWGMLGSRGNGSMPAPNSSAATSTLPAGLGTAPAPAVPGVPNPIPPLAGTPGTAGTPGGATTPGTAGTLDGRATPGTAGTLDGAAAPGRAAAPGTGAAPGTAATPGGSAAGAPSTGVSPVTDQARSGGRAGDNGRARRGNDVSERDADRAREDDADDDPDDYGDSRDDQPAHRGELRTSSSGGLLGVLDSLADALASLG